MTAVTYNSAMRRCAKCEVIQPICSKGWSAHPVYKLVCPACTAKRAAARAAKAAQVAATTEV